MNNFNFSMLKSIMIFLSLFFAVSGSLIAQICNDTFFVKFPDDRIITACDKTTVFGAPKYYGPADSMVATSFRDDTIWNLQDACFKIKRTWRVISWCSYKPTCPFFTIPNPAPNPLPNHPENMAGPVVSTHCNPDAADPWSATHIKISPTDTVTNFCNFWGRKVLCNDGSAHFNGYEYVQYITIVDTQSPTTTCLRPNTCDDTANDSVFWNQNYWWDANNARHDLCEMPIDLSITATDDCSGHNLTIHYELLLDLDGNGTPETLVSSKETNPVNTVYFGNALNPVYSGGEARAFDSRIVADPALDHYRFAIQYSTSGNQRTAALCFNTARSPDIYAALQLPHGQHKIKWLVSDACGNTTACEYSFTIRDCQKPMIECSSLSLNIPQTKIFEIWASTFMDYAIDNCSPFAKLKFAISTGDTPPAQFPRDSLGNSIVSITLDCKNIGPNVVQVWAEDAAGNAGYCQVILQVQDAIGNCGPIIPPFSGFVKTEANAPVGGVHFELSSPLYPAFPPASLYGSASSDSTGYYQLSSLNNALPVPSSAILCPERDDNHLNGVTTLDLALISRHILSLTPLNSPYKIIAADANKSGTITSLDIVTIRRLILGADNEFANNTSWRFINKSFVFPNPQNPFATTFAECISNGDLQNQAGVFNFIGVKIGDVNGTANANIASAASDDRTLVPPVGYRVFDRSVLPGDVFEVVFGSEEALFAQQFTLEHPGLEVLRIHPHTAGMTEAHFARFPERNLLTHVWNAEATDPQTFPEFTLQFRAHEAGQLSRMLHFSDQITPALAYSGADETAMKMPRLHFFTDSERFALYQNQPNPFSNTTQIGFYLPKSDRIALTILDETGRVVQQQERIFEKGYQQFTVSAAGLPGGVLFYRIAGAAGVLSGKMMVNR